MTRPARRPLGTLGFLIYDVARLMRRESLALRSERSLTQSQWRALAHLTRMEGCRQTELAEVLEIRPISLGRVVDQLEAAGLVVRRLDPHDRRARRLFLTRKAQPALDRLYARAQQLRAVALAGVSRAEQTRVIAALRIMCANLQMSPTAPHERR